MASCGHNHARNRRSVPVFALLQCPSLKTLVLSMSHSHAREAFERAHELGLGLVEHEDVELVVDDLPHVRIRVGPERRDYFCFSISSQSKIWSSFK